MDLSKRLTEPNPKPRARHILTKSESYVQGDCALWPGPNESVDQIAAPKQTYPSMHKVSDLPTVRMEAGHKRGYGLGATTLALTGRGLLMEVIV